jgi:APA family basic amino acid/polyamine antiporter
MAVALLLTMRTEWGARANTLIVAIKVVAVVLVICVGVFYVNPANWRPFAPFGLTGISFFGHTLFGQTGPGGEPVGMLAGAAIVFFAYIGFDAISTAAEEARNPSRDVPIGIIVSLVLCTFFMPSRPS